MTQGLRVQADSEQSACRSDKKQRTRCRGLSVVRILPNSCRTGEHCRKSARAGTRTTVRQPSTSVRSGPNPLLPQNYRRKSRSDYTRSVSIWRGSRTTHERNATAPATARQSVAPGHAADGLELGQWVGEYVIVRKLGEGGFGTVYEALHPVIGKRAAVKVLHAQYSADEAVTSRFAAEARAVNQIRHRNIVDIFSFGELPDGRQYYVMELLLGVPLDAYLDRAVRLEPEECLALLAEIAKALQAAHDAGIAHRDLKPENVFLELDDDQAVHPKILDFGMAKLLAPGTLPVHKTRGTTPIGSPRYMSPEQCRGVQVDHRTDVYAFGCMAYRMLAGVPPFDAGTALELMMAHVSAPPMPLSSIGPDLGPEIDECLLRMMEKNPENRPQSVQAAFESLRSAVAARFAAAASVSSLSAPPLLREMAEERNRVTTAPIDMTKLRRAPDNSSVREVRRRRLWLWPVVSLVAAAAVFALLRQQGVESRFVASTPSTIPDPTLATRATEATPTPSAQSDAQPAPKVAITVLSQPSHADLYLNNEKVGVAPGPLLMPKGEQSQTFVVKAPGYHPQTVTIVPSTDRSLHVALVPQKARSSGKLPRDLEDPY
jgi:eukaryotic-like serine/threonine-protein kinase